MRVFIGFKYQDGNGELQQVPVMYGDMNRQVANIIKENSENKMLNVPRIACYVTGYELDRSRISDSSFVSKVNIRERRWEADDVTGERNYQGVQGGNYTVERLMPTPYKLTMKADIWTSNTDQKLQLLEQITVLFNPSLEIQSTDNYLDWTSLTVLEMDTIQYSSRSIPQGVDTDIDIASLSFEMPIWISPPAKVKKLGIIQSIITNVFTDDGSVVSLDELAFNQNRGTWEKVINRTDFDVLLLQSQEFENQYEVTIVDQTQVVELLDSSERPKKLGLPVEWIRILEPLGGYKPGSQIFFKQENGSELVGTFVVNESNSDLLIVTFDIDTIPGNTKIDSQGKLSTDDGFNSDSAQGTVSAIINPQTYNPIVAFGGIENIPVGHRLLILDDIGSTINQNGASAWRGVDNVDLVAEANSIIRWNGTSWNVIFDPTREYSSSIVVQNLKTLIKYRWVDDQWLRAFEGEYRRGSWGLILSS